MSHSRLAVVILLLYQGLGEAQSSTMKHLGEVKRDIVVKCIASVLGKAVFYHTLQRPLSDVGCSTDRAEMLATLGRQDIAFAEGSDWALLYPAWLSKPRGTLDAPIRWESLSIVQSTSNWEGVPNTRPLSQDEQALFLRSVVAHARPAPVSTPRVADLGSQTATIEYFKRLLSVRLVNHAELALAIVGTRGGTARLVSAEIRKNRFFPLWDSPLFNGIMLQIGFEDVDGDGKKEILLQSSYGLTLSGQMLSILDDAGNELTRDLPCVVDTFQYDADSGLCPIAAESLVLEDRGDGKRDLIVRRRHHDVGTDSYDKSHRYTLRSGRYAHVGLVQDRASR